MPLAAFRDHNAYKPIILMQDYWRQQAKSLKSYRERLKPIMSVRASLADFRYGQELVDLQR